MSPGVAPPSGDYLAARFKKIEADITALATTQNQYVLDHNGTQRLALGWQQIDGTYALVAFDASGNRRAMLGSLPNGDHGIELIDAAGTKQELLPAIDDYVGTTLSTTSGTPVGLSGSPFVNITIGANGDWTVRSRLALTPAIPRRDRPMPTWSSPVARPTASSA